MSPTQRTKALLEKDGWQVGIVEKWNAHTRVRQDLWGFADLVACKPGQLPLLVQVTSGSNVAARRTKILAEPRARFAAHSGYRIEVHGWRKVRKVRGGTAMVWRPRIIAIEQSDFPPCQPLPFDVSPS